MRIRTIIILLVVLVVLSLLANISSRKSRIQVPEGPVAGDAVLPGFDVNAVSRVELSDGETETILERKNGVWVVASLFDYPADFARLADQLRKLADLKVGQLMRGGVAQLDEFGLADGKASQIVLKDESSNTLASLSLGGNRMGGTQGAFGGFPQGQYIRVGNGPVLLIENAVNMRAGAGETWVKRDLVNVDVSNVREVSVKKDGQSFSMRIPESGKYEMDGVGEDEQVNADLALRLARALQYLTLQSVADPALSDEELGFDDPAEYTAVTPAGLVYNVKLGKQVEGTDGRYARMSVSYVAPPAPAVPEQSEEEADPTAAEASAAQLKEYEERCAADKARAEQENSIVAGWTYVLGSFAADSMMPSRESMIQPVEKTSPPSEEEPSTEADAAGEDADN